MRTCSFCEEIVNERFREAVSSEEMRVKQEALSLLEGMLTVRVWWPSVAGRWLLEREASALHGSRSRPTAGNLNPVHRQNKQVTPDERVSIKQVLGHPWLAAERAQDPQPIDTEETALLFPVPRPREQQGAPPPPPLQVHVRIMEFPYLRDPECTIVASSYRNGTADVRLGCVAGRSRMDGMGMEREVEETGIMTNRESTYIRSTTRV